MLIYEWTSYSSVTPFRLPNGKESISKNRHYLSLTIYIDTGFPLNKSKSIILTVVYKKEKVLHKEQTGILLDISTES